MGQIMKVCLQNLAILSTIDYYQSIFLLSLSFSMKFEIPIVIDS